MLNKKVAAQLAAFLFLNINLKKLLLFICQPFTRGNKSLNARNIKTLLSLLVREFKEFISFKKNEEISKK